MRIVYYNPPSTPGQYFWLAFKTFMLSYVGIAIFYFLFSMVSGFDNTLTNFLYGILIPVTEPVFRWAGLYDISQSMAGFYTLFILLTLPSLMNIIPMMRLKMEQLRLLDEAYGPVKKPEHLFWFYGTAFFLFGLLSIRYIETDSGDGLQQVFIDCSRIALVLICAVCTICFLLVGMRLRASWKKSPEALQMALPGAKPKKKKPGNLKIAVDNSKTVRPTTSAALPQLNTVDSDTGIYVALTAEMIQAAGRLKALPTPDVLIGPLEMMQKAALMTRSGQYSHSDIKGLCERACSLLADGQLVHLPDLAAAQALYKRANPAKLVDIATELKQKLEAPLN